MTDPLKAVPILPSVDGLIADPSFAEPCFELFERWSRLGRGPAIALGWACRAHTCVRLRRLNVVPVTKEEAFAGAKAIAELLVEPVDREPVRSAADGANAFSTLLRDLRQRGSSYAQFAEDFENHAIREALSGGRSVKGAAAWLGMHRSTLISKLRKAGVGPTRTTDCPNCTPA